MFISNPSPLLPTFKCCEKVGKYIVEHYKIPILSISSKNEYIFSATPELDEVIAELPILLKLFYL